MKESSDCTKTAGDSPEIQALSRYKDMTQTFEASAPKRRLRSPGQHVKGGVLVLPFQSFKSQVARIHGTCHHAL